MIQELFDIQEKAVPSTYLIATPEIYHESIIESLQWLVPFYKESAIDEPQVILCINDIENQLMEAYYRYLSAERQLSGSYITVHNLLEEIGKMQTEKLLNDLGKVQVYQVKSHVDKQLSGQNAADAVKQPRYLIPIQADAGLADE